jgi:uncharacterized protein YjbI with pentapeptide repeats
MGETSRRRPVAHKRRTPKGVTWVNRELEYDDFDLNTGRPTNLVGVNPFDFRPDWEKDLYEAHPTWGSWERYESTDFKQKGQAVAVDRFVKVTSEGVEVKAVTVQTSKSGREKNTKEVSARVEPGCRVHLPSWALHGIDLSGLDLEYITFVSDRLEDMNLSGCNLHDSLFDARSMENIMFDNAVLTSSQFIHVGFHNVFFRGANVQNMLLRKCTVPHYKNFNSLPSVYVEGSNISGDQIAAIEKSTFQGEVTANVFSYDKWDLDAVKSKFEVDDEGLRVLMWLGEIELRNSDGSAATDVVDGVHVPQWNFGLH